MTDKMNDNELDRLFREKFEGEEASPPAFTWPKIERELGKTARRPGGWYWWLSGIALLFIGAGAWWMLGNHTEPVKLTENKSGINSTQNVSSSNSALTEKNNSVSSNTAFADSAKTQTVDQSVSANVSDADKTIPQSGENKPAGSPGFPKKKGVEKPVPSNASNSSPETVKLLQAMARKKNNQGAADPFIFPGGSGNGKPVSSFEKTDSTNHLPAIVYDQQNKLGHDANPDPKKDLPLTAPGLQKETTADNPSGKTDIHDPSDSLKREETLVKKNKLPADSVPLAIFPTEAQLSDSLKAKGKLPVAGLSVPPPEALPVFFAGFHAAMENQKIASSERYEEDFTNTDIILYQGDEPPVVTQQTYNYGGRFGWFASKHFALLGSVYYNTFEVTSPGRFIKYNHTNEYQFNLHSATATASLPSYSFTYADNYGPPGDTFWVKVVSAEKYSFLNFQLGASYYPIRTKHFGVYVNLLSNGAYLTKQQMTLTSVKTGNSFVFEKGSFTGMNTFTLGGQTGAGFEYTPIRNLGIWIEPAYFFSATLNKKNSFAIKPSAIRFQCGLSAHF